MNHFSAFQLPESLNRALHALKFQQPTPIQSQAIPIALNGKDLIATAQTGTGKTAAFCIPIAVFLMKNSGRTALVLTPTRELAMQIELFWKELTRGSQGLHAACLIGGASFSVQNKALARRPRLIIATPGRLLDHLDQRTANLTACGILVLDEADRMLDMGFAPQLSQILKRLPVERQSLMFSATWESNLDQLSKRYLRSPERVAVGQTSQAAKTIDQSTITTSGANKNEALLDELNQRDGSVLVFARTQRRVDRLAKYLDSYGLVVGRLHGGRTQGQRNSALSAFRNGNMRILVATDIAARGIDVADIGHVINYDLPQSPEDYIHRIGRTGRAGAAGKALSLITPEDQGLWRSIAKLLDKTRSGQPETRAWTRTGATPVRPESPRSEPHVRSQSTRADRGAFSAKPWNQSRNNRWNKRRSKAPFAARTS